MQHVQPGYTWASFVQHEQQVQTWLHLGLFCAAGSDLAIPGPVLCSRFRPGYTWACFVQQVQTWLHLGLFCAAGSDLATPGPVLCSRFRPGYTWACFVQQVQTWLHLALLLCSSLCLVWQENQTECLSLVYKWPPTIHLTTAVENQ